MWTTVLLYPPAPWNLLMMTTDNNTQHARCVGNISKTVHSRRPSLVTSCHIVLYQHTNCVSWAQVCVTDWLTAACQTDCFTICLCAWSVITDWQHSPYAAVKVIGANSNFMSVGRDMVLSGIGSIYIGQVYWNACIVFIWLLVHSQSAVAPGRLQ